MPNIREQIEKYYQQITRQRDERGKNRQRELRVLPGDLTGQVYDACVEEGQKVKARIAWLNEELERVGVQLEEAQAAVRIAYDHCWTEPKIRGDILDGPGQYEIVRAQPDPNRMIVTKEALEIRKERVEPLRRYQRSLKRELFARESELSELRTVARMATTGRINLINFLSKKWLSRLEIGPGVAGTLAKLSDRYRATVPVDSAGNPLPPESLGIDGEPDMDMSGRRAPK